MEYKKDELEQLHSIELDLYAEFKRICEKYQLCFVTGFGTTLGAIRHQGFIPWDDDMDFLMPRKDYERFLEVAPKELGELYGLLEPRTEKNYVMAFAKLIRKDSTFIEKTDLHIRYHNGIFIDIFPMDYWPCDKKKRDRVAFRCYVLLRLCSLATYKKPKLPAGMKPWKKHISYFGCGCIHYGLKLFGFSTQRLYKRFLKYAMSTSKEDGDSYVTDLMWCWIRDDGMFGLQYKDEDLFTPLWVPFENVMIPVPEKYDSYLTIAYKDYRKLPPVENRHCHMPAVLKFPEE